MAVNEEVAWLICLFLDALFSLCDWIAFGKLTQHKRILILLF